MAITTTALNGTNLKLYVDTVLLGHLTSNSLGLSANMIETSSKDTGKYAEFIAGRLTGTVSFEALHYFNATEGYKEMIADIKAGTQVALEITNSNADDYKWTANALLSSLDVDFPDDDIVSYSGEFQITGEPTYVVIT